MIECIGSIWDEPGMDDVRPPARPRGRPCVGDGPPPCETRTDGAAGECPHRARCEADLLCCSAYSLWMQYGDARRSRDRYRTGEDHHAHVYHDDERREPTEQRYRAIFSR